MGYATIHLILFIVLWMTLSIISATEYLPFTRYLKGKDLFLFYLVFTFGGPIFGINQVLTSILDSILPEGWDDEDDLNKGH